MPPLVHPIGKAIQTCALCVALHLLSPVLAFGFSRPDISRLKLGTNAPVVSALSAIIVDDKTGKVLWSKDSDTPRFPASTTKIMTGLLLAERCKPDDIIVAPEDVQTVTESSMHLKPGERVRARDMLYALMLRSANDGCYAVAMHISGSVEKFAALMNARAKEMGCLHTHFHNSNGLNDPQHTISARDLACIARTAMKNPWFRETVGTYRMQINRSLNWKDTWMVNHNKSLRHDPSADGIKTGYTVPAGHCFVGSATRNGYRLVTVILKSKNWQQDNSSMMKWAFSNFERVSIASQGLELAKAEIPGSSEPSIPIGLSQSIDSPVHKSIAAQVWEPMPPIFVAMPGLIAPIKKGDVVGTLEFADKEGFTLKSSSIALSDAPASAALLVRQKTNSVGMWAFGAIIGGSALVVRRKRQRIYARSTSTTSPTPPIC